MPSATTPRSTIQDDVKYKSCSTSKQEHIRIKACKTTKLALHAWAHASHLRVLIRLWLQHEIKPVRAAKRAARRAARITYSDHLLHRNDDCREERRYNDRDRHHDDRPESSRAGRFRRRRPDVLSKAKSRFNIFLNIPQPSYIPMMFLRAVLSMFVLQTIFFHVYHLKDDIQLILRQIPEQSY